MDSKSFGRIGVLMGGPSNEREISLKSGEAVFSALKSRGYNVVGVELGPLLDGDLLGYTKKVKKEIQGKDIDFAFVALHGGFGEDGGLQEVLEELKIPYTGSGVVASRLGMDKIRSKEFFKNSGLIVPDFKVIPDSEILRSWPEQLGKKVVVKPFNQGSSIGVYIVEDLESINQAIKDIRDFCLINQATTKREVVAQFIGQKTTCLINQATTNNKIILERFIEGEELTVGILEDRALPVIEICPRERFFNYRAKYEKGITDYIVPARLDEPVYSKCQEIALRAHKALGARFFSRVDMILSKGDVFVLELNTIPGMTRLSLLPRAAKAEGISFEDLCVKIMDSVFK